MSMVYRISQIKTPTYNKVGVFFIVVSHDE